MTIGEILRKAREAKGFSVQDVQTATRMTARQVTDLENDDYSSFAYPFYTKGFLRQYARAVGLDPAPLVSRWSAESAASGDPPQEIKPVVPLETIDEESGGLRVVKPDPPGLQAAPHEEQPRRDRPEKKAVPAPEAPPKDTSPKPEKRAAAADPAFSGFASGTQPFQKEPAPLPEKRVAEIRPGEVAPEPVSLRAPEIVAAREIRPVRDLPPVVKKLPVDLDEGTVAAFPASASVPDFIESPAPAFVFPGVVPDPDGDAEPVPVAEPKAEIRAPAKVPAPAPAAEPEPKPEPKPEPVPDDGPGDSDLPLFAQRPTAAETPVAAAAPVPASVPVAAADSAPAAARAPAPAPTPPPPRRKPSVEPADDDDPLFGVSDAFSTVPRRKFRFPMPSRLVLYAGGGLAALLVVAGLVAAFSGGPAETPEPPTLDDAEEIAETGDAPSGEPAPGGGQAVAVPPRPVKPEAILPPPRSFAR